MPTNGVKLFSSVGDFTWQFITWNVKKTISLDDKMLMDDKIFKSIMQSKRQFREIEIQCGGSSAASEKLVIVMEKFKNHLEKLVIITEETFTRFLEAASELEQIWLFERKVRKCAPQKQFTKLKQLYLFAHPEICPILEKIPDDFLEVLGFGKTKYDIWSFSENLKAFVSRQKKLKRLDIPRDLMLNTDHLKLKDLMIYTTKEEEKKLAAMLKKQHTLQGLYGQPFIGKAAFEEIRQMPNLRVLEGRFAEEVAGELESVWKLSLFRSPSALSQVVLPELEELVLDESSGSHEQYAVLGRIAQKLRKIELFCTPIDDFPAIIEHFPELETLLIELIFAPDDNASYTAPSRQNLGLTELIIRFDLGAPTVALKQYICDTINVCPNLERIQLDDVQLNKCQVLGLIQRHPYLTHFWIGASNWELFDANNSEDGALDPVLIQIINVFKRSLYFVSITFSQITDCNKQSVEDSLAAKADRITVTKSSESFMRAGLCELKLVKKSVAKDPFENFHEREFQTVADPEFDYY